MRETRLLNELILFICTVIIRVSGDWIISVHVEGHNEFRQSNDFYNDCFITKGGTFIV